MINNHSYFEYVVTNNYQQLNKEFINFWATRINSNLQALNEPINWEKYLHKEQSSIGSCQEYNYCYKNISLTTSLTTNLYLKSWLSIVALFNLENDYRYIHTI